MADNPGLNVGGITPFTTIDFPGHLAAVLFCQGCPWRCRYCHNPHLLPMAPSGKHAWADILSWLETRKGLLEGVVLSGGEPLAQRHLIPSVAQLRDMGYAVALHTSGVSPRRFREVLPSIDWVGLDIKAPFDEYDAITASGAVSGEHAKEVLVDLLASGKAHELRCTLDPDYFTPERAAKMANQLVGLGAGHLIVQSCRDNEHRHSKPVAEAIRTAFEQILPNVQYRS